MTEIETNQRIADRICQDHEYDHQHFEMGDCVALLDGQVVAVTENFDEALRQLRAIDPDPNRGMLFEVRPPVVDVVR